MLKTEKKILAIIKTWSNPLCNWDDVFLCALRSVFTFTASQSMVWFIAVRQTFKLPLFLLTLSKQNVLFIDRASEDIKEESKNGKRKINNHFLPCFCAMINIIS